MPRPGTNISIVDDAAPSGAILDTSQAFFVGVSERGPLGAVKVNGLKDYQAKYGDRTGGSLLYDAVYAYFAEGGTSLYVSRAVGNTGVSASATGAGGLGALNITAIGPGVWANDVTVRVLAGSVGTTR